MKRYEIIKEFLDNKNDSEKGDESIDEQKSRLKKQIDHLKSIILDIEWNLGVLKFGKTKCTFDPDDTDSLTIDSIPDINKQLEFQLYKYSGFCCVKFTKYEYVFNFSSSNKYDNKNTFAVQILNNEEKGTLGKWLMPMAIDLNHLVSEIPIDNLKNVPNFLRTCKHYTDCYFIRHQQYATLMANISDMRNCIIQTNLGYTQISLELMGVYDKNTDCYMNIIIYLLYNIDEVRPHKIAVDSMNDDNLDKRIKKELQESLKSFKMFDLCVAFEKILNKEPYIWSRQSGEDSPLDIGAPSGSDEEGYLESFSSQKKKSFSLEKVKQGKRKRKRHDKTESVEKHSNLPNTSSNDEKSVSIQSEEKMLKNLSQQDTDVKINNLKQTKLKFVLTDSKSQSMDNVVDGKLTPSKNKKINKQIHKLCTSTPVSSNVPCSTNFTSSNVDISDITNSESTSNNIKVKKHHDVTTKNRSKVEEQYENATPVKFVQSQVKRKTKSVQPELRNSNHKKKIKIGRKNKNGKKKNVK
ncbi:hypothetical protein ANTPLA_LOCUS11129 [Anthophora plagiata]